MNHPDQALDGHTPQNSIVATPKDRTSIEAHDEIVSVNKRGGGADNKLAKGIFILMVGAVLVGVLSWFGQSWINQKKADMRISTAPKSDEPGPDLFNPEKTGAGASKPKIGAAGGATPPASPIAQPGQKDGDCMRPLRGSDGKVMVDSQGQALAVDCNGNVLTVPAINTAGDPLAVRTPLPGQQAGQGSGQAGPPPPSRYGGSLFVGVPAKSQPVSSANTNAPQQMSGVEAYKQTLKAMGIPVPGTNDTGAAMPTRAPSATLLPGQPSGTAYNPHDGTETREGSVGKALYSSATPVALAKRFPTQDFMMPKGRQADCILTGRIVDEVPGFTSCVLAQNMYSDNGRVLLLERGSEMSGEYGITNQLGSERLFVTWSRVKTPQGIVVDLTSPGTDRLGTSGLPGHLDNRWGERIAAALLLSLVKDISVAYINSQSKPQGSGTSVSVGSPGQNTANAGAQLAEEVIKQTMKVRPRLTINEGERIAIYVARDLDFSSVYTLRESGGPSAVRPLVR
jgi:type IV secretion system protein VirB10